MSNDLTDIYITRDRFDQGELHGRLVCAIYVDQNFVEITVHPADGGRVVDEPVSTAPAPADGISRDEALDTAHAMVPDAEEWEVVAVNVGAARAGRATRVGGI